MEIFTGPRGGQFRIVGGLKRYDVPGEVLKDREDAIQEFGDGGRSTDWLWQWICVPVLTLLAALGGIVLALFLYFWMLDSFFWFTLCFSFVLLGALQDWCSAN
jgi:hypothetical protein